MRISDWSSDVCSSDLDRTATAGMSLRLDLSGKRRVRRDAAAARLDQAAIEARLDRRDFVQPWFSGWAEWRTAEQRAQTGQRRVSLVRRFAAIAVQQVNSGDNSGVGRGPGPVGLGR